MTARRPTRPYPAVPAGTTVIEVTGGPDDLGRHQFRAYWADNNAWRGGSGVSGQAFATRLDDFAARTETDRVLVITPAGHVPVATYLRDSEATL